MKRLNCWENLSKLIVIFIVNFIQCFNISTDLCSHHDYVFFVTPCSPTSKKTLKYLAVTPQSSGTPITVTCCSTFCLCRFACFGYFYKCDRIAYDIFHLWYDFHIHSCKIKYLHFPYYGWIIFCCTDIPHFVHNMFNGQLGYFWFLVVVKDAAGNSLSYLEHMFTLPVIYLAVKLIGHRLSL